MTNPIILYEHNIGSATVTVTSEATGYEKENAYDDLTYDYWKPTAAGTVYFTMDFGAAVAVDAWGVFVHNLGTNGASIQLQYSTDNFSADTNDFSTAISPTGTEPRLQTGTSQTKRYWRFKVVSASAASKIGGLMIGEAMTLSEGLRPGFEPDHLAQQYEPEINRSVNAAFLQVSTRKKMIEGKMQFNLLTRPWVEANWKTFVQSVELGKGFLYQPDADNYPEQVIYAKAKSNIKTPRYDSAMHMSVSLDYVAIAD